MFIDPRKLTAYLLNEDHPVGAAKARFFTRFGFDIQQWQEFAEALKQHLSTAVLDDIDGSSAYGEKRTYRCNLPTPDGRDPCILSVWQFRGDDWHLVTAVPQPE
ncbi:DUF6883 domain-containing protein [Lacibacterium aquatile]|uniref:DUF6883 domain-containing protein n=1 Tax=Lacibacterium aquatile TaxID=1168082 RepID=A0ABW5DWE3_9PROT